LKNTSGLETWYLDNY